MQVKINEPLKYGTNKNKLNRPTQPGKLIAAIPKESIDPDKRHKKILGSCNR